MTQLFFVTGTDTEVGKTFVCCKLLQGLNRLNYSTMAMKPVASGAMIVDGILKNDDALKLQQAASVPMDYHQVNPFVFKEFIAPHIAAKKACKKIMLSDIVSQIERLKKFNANVLIIEGAGGFRVPINATQELSHLAVQLKIPVILVVAIRLGCINHALLSVESIHLQQAPFAGWIANCLLPDYEVMAENIQILKQKIAAPCLGIVPYETENHCATKVASPEENIITLPFDNFNCKLPISSKPSILPL